MAVPTRTELESWKRPALQQKCKELGIKANSKSEVLIDLILSHYQAGESQQPGPSKPSISAKRKAATATEADQDPSNNSDGDDEVVSDNHVSAPQRQISTRRRGAQLSISTAPPAKLRRVGTKTRLKKEPSDGPSLATPRHGTIMEVVLDSPRRSAKGKAKEGTGRDKDTSTEITQSQSRDEGSQGVSGLTEAAKRAMPGAKPLEPLKTTTTDIEIESAHHAPSIAPETSIDETRISDLELQLRNVRKFNDEASRDIRVLYAFQETIEQAFGDTPNLSDSMTFLAKLRDITPKLVALSSIDLDGFISRLDSAEQKVATLEIDGRQNRSTIAELKERVRELEEGKSAVGDLEATVRQIQSQLNTLPAALTQGNVAIEDSGTERIYTLIRGPSLTSSSSAARPSSRLSVPPEENTRPSNQDQNENQGRASSISRGRSVRPPLAEKEGVRVGQPDVEVETADPRRSIRRLAESSLSSTGNSAPPSRGRSTTPGQRESSSGNATPSQAKGKGRLGKSTTARLDTVEEHGDTSIREEPAADAPRLSINPNSLAKGSPAATSATTSTSGPAEADAPERLPSPPPAPNPFSPDLQPPRSPARFFEVGQDDPSGSPPSSASKSSSRAATNRGSSPIRSLAPQATDPPTNSKNGPITQLPFKLIASPIKPQTAAGPSAPRPPVPSGRVAKAPRSSQQPYARRAGGSRKNAESTSEAPKEAASVFGFALPGASSSTSAGGGSTSAAAPSQLDNPAGFITPERLGNNFNLFPSRFDLGKTPGGLAFKATGRPPPGTPAATTTLFGTEVARDTRFADLPYDPDASREGLSWEEPSGLSLWPGAAPRSTNTTE
ncbi:hypothetical protein RhiJN_04375 [Ceratobasidium sp. AG-Ba]|nr:hypothetical protein RhiJN_04375 [Ceratobasidium sp. AG-Ba]